MKPYLFGVLVLSLAGCGGSGSSAATCPAGSIKVPLDPSVMEQPELLEFYPDKAVCLSKAQAPVDMAAAMAQADLTPVPSIHGEYRYDDFGTPSAPIVNLQESDGTGGASKWQDHGCQPNDIEWGMEVVPEGPAAIHQEGVGGIKLRVWRKMLRKCHYACTPGLICEPEREGEEIADSVANKWRASDLIIATEESFTTNSLPGRINILGERWK
jgi:hypothetical protein